MKRVVVTGASGFIGAYLIQELLKDTENEIYAIIRPNSSNRDRVPQDDRVKIVELDMAQIEELPSYVPGQVEGFYHLAWNGTRGETRDDEKRQKENYEASLLAAKTAEKLQAKMFLGSGSQAEYGIVKEVVSEADEAKPTTAYGKMKKQTYDALKEYFANTSVKLYWVRPLKEFVLEMKEILHSESEIQFGAVPYGPAGPVNLCPDVSKIKRQLKWQAKTKFDEGIEEILKKKWR